MRKLIILIFFLIGSLVMSSSFTLISNVDLVSNATAQEYDNSYNKYDDYKYSKYPTEINRYECQTGPLEGFFVSSVEFCKIDGIKGDKGQNR